MGKGAAPAAATAGLERPAERPSGLRMRTRYARAATGSMVRLAGSESVALLGPGATVRRTTAVQGAFSERVEANGAVSRQISAMRGVGALRPSVVRAGVVQ